MKYLIPTCLNYDGSIVPAKIVDMLPQERKDSMKWDIIEDACKQKLMIQQDFRQRLMDIDRDQLYRMYEI